MEKFKLVPVEPTDEMLSAMWSLMHSMGASSKTCYEALIAAAPAPTVGEEVLAEVEFEGGMYHVHLIQNVEPGTELVDRAHVTRLQVENERLSAIERSYELREALLTQVKGERDRMIDRTIELSKERNDLLTELTLSRRREKPAHKKRGPKSTITPEKLELMKKLKREGLTWDDMAERFGYSVGHIQRTLGPAREFS